jgi:hypothetical protein
MRAGPTVQAMLGDDRVKGRDLGDLMATRLGVEAFEDAAASAAGLGEVIDDGLDLPGWDQGPLMTPVTGLAAASLARGLARRGSLDARGVGRGGPRGVGGVEIEPCFEVGNSLLERGILPDQPEDQRLEIRRC